MTKRICDNVYVKGIVDVTDHCHVIGKYRGSANKDSNMKVELNHKITVVFHNLKKFWFSSYYARTRQIKNYHTK